MALYCPRDSTKLSWIQFALKGRWACGKCQGNLVFDRHLKTHPAGLKLLASLAAVPSQAGVTRCPSCGNAMRTLAPAAFGSIEIDRCETCHLTWFDPSELKAMVPLQATPETAVEIQSDAATDEDYRILAKLLLELRDHSGERRWRENTPLLQSVGIFLVLISIALIGATHGTSHEYAMRVRGASSPQGFALSALIASGIFTWKSQKFWWAGLLAVMFLFQSIITLMARF